MARTKIANTNLLWLFREKLQEFDDFPRYGIPIAVVPTSNGDWRVLMPNNVQVRRRWASRIEAIEKRLRMTYTLVS